MSAPALARRPVAPGLFTWPDEPARLLGGRCGPCGTVVFPAQDGCPRCGAQGMAVTELGDVLRQLALQPAG